MSKECGQTYLEELKEAIQETLDIWRGIPKSHGLEIDDIYFQIDERNITLSLAQKAAIIEKLLGTSVQIASVEADKTTYKITGYRELYECIITIRRARRYGRPVISKLHVELEDRDIEVEKSNEIAKIFLTFDDPDLLFI